MKNENPMPIVPWTIMIAMAIAGLIAAFMYVLDDFFGIKFSGSNPYLASIFLAAAIGLCIFIANLIHQKTKG